MAEGWRKAKLAANKLMDKGNFTVDDVRNDLANLRDTYEDDPSDVSKRLKDINEKIDANADRLWEQAYKNLDELTKGISKREDGTIILDPNNPYQVAWFESDDDEDEDDEDDYPEPIDSLEQGLRDMQRMRKGEIPKKTWREFCSELKYDEDSNT